MTSGDTELEREALALVRLREEHRAQSAVVGRLRKDLAQAEKDEASFKDALEKARMQFNRKMGGSA